MPIRIVPAAAGATQLLVSPRAAFAVAEIREPWLHEEYESGDHAPGVLKLLDHERALVTAFTGWPLGAPDESGGLLYVEEAPHEYRYRVAGSRATGEPVALAPPDGFWHVKATVGVPDAGCAAVVLWSPIAGHDWRDPAERRDSLWLASIDRQTRAVRATRSLALTTPLPERGRYARGVAAGAVAGAGLIALLEVPEPDADDSAWHVHALDCATLSTRWRTRLEVSQTASPGAPPGSPPGSPPASPSGKIGEQAAPTAPTSARDERLLATADLAFSGDGMRLGVVYGRSRSGVISAPTLFVLDTATGALVGTVSDRIAHDVSAIVPMRGPRVALEHRSSFRGGGGPHRESVYHGVSAADLDRRTSVVVVDPKALEVHGWTDVGSILPSGLAARGAAIELVPERFAWANDHAEAGPAWPAGSATATGAQRAEVAQWVTLPRTWHRPGRGQVQAHDAWMESTRRAAPPAPQ